MHLTKTARGITIAILALALIGFLDATYLAVKHYVGGAIPCSILHGCEVVTTSAYSEIFNIPISLFGSLFYLTLIVLVIFFLDSKKEILRKMMLGLSSLGFLTSLFLVYLQFFVINALCFYCMISALTSTLLFLANVWLYRIFKKSSAESAL